LINVGKVLRSHGKDGELRLRFYQKAAIQFSGLDRLSIGKEGEEARTFRVESLLPRGKATQVKLEGVESLASADHLVGMNVFVTEDQLKPAEDGHFYIFQLIGCLVQTMDGEKIGRVVDVLSAGESDSLVVESRGREVLIPFHTSICPAVDVARGEIRINPPAGLLDLNEI